MKYIYNIKNIFFKKNPFFLTTFFYAFYIFFMPSAYADNNVVNTTENSSQTQNTQIRNTVSGNAQDWGLTAEEWAHYLVLMKGKNAHWYPQLTPPEILGLNAENLQEQSHFALLVAKETHDKLARELSFNNAVYEAMLKLYKEEKIIRPFHLLPYSPAPLLTKNEAQNQ